MLLLNMPQIYLNYAYAKVYAKYLRRIRQSKTTLEKALTYLLFCHKQPAPIKAIEYFIVEDLEQ